jgi:hypothetical protein
MRKLSVLLIVVLLVTLVGTATAGQGIPEKPGSLWANGNWDAIEKLESMDVNSHLPANTADDFVLGWDDYFRPGQDTCPRFYITQIRGTLITSSHPTQAFVQIYADRPGQTGPANSAPLYTFPMTALHKLSDWPNPEPGDPDLDVYQYWFNTPPNLPGSPNLELDRGTYWVSVVGMGDGTGTDVSYMATSWGNSNPIDPALTENGYFKSPFLGFPAWVPGEDVINYDYASDYAFDVDGRCMGTEMSIVSQEMSFKIVLRSPMPAWWKVTTKVTVYDANGLPVSNATVYGAWTDPDGDVLLAQSLTNSAGLATFIQRNRAEGVYAFCVTDIRKLGWVYEPLDDQGGPCTWIDVNLPK